MNREKKEALIRIVVLLIGFVFAVSFLVYMGEVEKSEKPEPYFEFSPKKGVTFIKTGYGVGCWKD